MLSTYGEGNGRNDWLLMVFDGRAALDFEGKLGQYTIGNRPGHSSARRLDSPRTGRAASARSGGTGRVRSRGISPPVADWFPRRWRTARNGLAGRRSCGAVQPPWPNRRSHRRWSPGRWSADRRQEQRQPPRFGPAPPDAPGATVAHGPTGNSSGRCPGWMAPSPYSPTHYRRCRNATHRCRQCPPQVDREPGPTPPT